MDKLQGESSLFQLIVKTRDMEFLKNIIMGCSTKTIFRICEISKNILAGNINLDKKEKSSLIKYKYLMRKLSLRTKNVSLIFRRKLLIKNIKALKFILLPFLNKLYKIKET
jgi:hypothetical protein